jgi:hypothetical protein
MELTMLSPRPKERVAPVSVRPVTPRRRTPDPLSESAVVSFLNEAPAPTAPPARIVPPAQSAKSMKAVACPRCQYGVPSEMTVCPKCRVRITPDHSDWKATCRNAIRYMQDLARPE